jgi:predicted SnoaL-like aldol condensation-catalyzing enzyme
MKQVLRAGDEETGTGASAALIEDLRNRVFNAHDLSRVEAYYHPDVIDHHPGVGEGLDGVRAYLHERFVAFPDVRFDVDHVVAQNHRVMVFGTWHGHAEMSGAPLRLPTADLYRLADGKVAEHWDVVDYSALAPFGVTAPDQEQPASEPDWRVPEVQRSNLRLALRVWDEIMTQHHLDRADDYFTHDYIQHNRFAAEAGAGLDGFKTFFGGLFMAMPDLSGTIVHIVAQEDRVGLFATWRGHMVGTDEKLALHTADLVRIENGKIAEHWDVFDYSAVAPFGIAVPS